MTSLLNLDALMTVPTIVQRLREEWTLMDAAASADGEPLHTARVALIRHPPIAPHVTA